MPRITPFIVLTNQSRVPESVVSVMKCTGENYIGWREVEITEKESTTD